ncbi:hypothetical protein [Thermus phage P23-45]|uniref:Decoration protein n=1 Tax=Thermus virus P23-45 TaxID=2914006 RepID=DECO_BP234|nr:hypothetical protein P23p88 [Thermus phage P23-45]A7XXC1.1 RecName: Full=Decoration protein; AltName: Full=Auxilliary protein; AltName: Full=Gene product 88; Short=gp88 [Thermus phage P23-45]6I9E_H Chain H, Auxiliary protein [Oshimavirus P2345]6I9E_I Chain I, Auxiliary protein [Oshimavirus P2345]6I9E_J Chain J, Auxiliary protein [Oshimavirus P2345]6I9E_K Chain K, Auxiliary protein [Oshimavirus P2345]6I9E_L Chain L, Auxiliary protein [Oshimavirus P2345]6I9E_M Chain M, Auxiliary protein [Os
MDKVKLFQTIGRVEYWERVPRLHAYGVFALPFPMDPDVNWAQWFTGPHPRAFLVSIHKYGPKAGHVYPTNLTDEDALLNVIGMVLDGHDYENDPNVTVTLKAAVPIEYVQQDPQAPALQPHQAVLDAAEVLKLKVIKGHYFFDYTR